MTTLQGRIRRTAVRSLAAIGRIPFRMAGVLRRRRLVVYYAWPDFARKAAAIADLLRRRGFPAELRSGVTPLRYLSMSASRDLWIGFWNEYRTDYIPRDYFFVNGEQLDLPHWRDDESWIRGLRGAIEVWDYSKSNERHVAALGVPYRHVPFGYAPFYEEDFQRNIRGKSLSEDIDVLFVGTLTPRRQGMIDRLQSSGAKIYTVTRDNPAHGAKLDELYARAKITLVVYSYDDPAGQLADFARLDHLLSNRRYLIQETPSPLGRDAALEGHVTTVPYDEIANACVRMLAQPEERRRIADAAYQWFRSERALDDFIPYDVVRERLERR
jgi:hypothetical protein